MASEARDWPAELEAGIEAFNEGGPQGFVERMTSLDLLHADLLFHIQEDLPNGGDWRGLEGFAELNDRWLEPWEEFGIISKEYIQAADGVFLVPVTQRAVSRDGIEIADEFFYVFIIRDEQLAEMHIYRGREQAERAIADVSPGSR